VFALSLRTRFAIACVLIQGAMVLVGLLAWKGMFASNDGLRTVYEERVVPLEMLERLADAYAVNVIDSVNRANAGVMTAEEALRNVHEAQAAIRTQWKRYMATNLTPRETELAWAAWETMPAAHMAIEALEVFLTSKSGSLEGQLSYFEGELYTSIDPVRNNVRALLALQLRIAQVTYEVAYADSQHKQRVVTAICVVASIMEAVVFCLLYRKVTRNRHRYGRKPVMP